MTGRGCTIASYLDTLTEADRTAIDTHLNEWGGAKTVWQWLLSRGVRVSVSAVRTHKRRECPCGYQTEETLAA